MPNLHPLTLRIFFDPCRTFLPRSSSERSLFMHAKRLGAWCGSSQNPDVIKPTDDVNSSFSRVHLYVRLRVRTELPLSAEPFSVCETEHSQLHDATRQAAAGKG